MVENGYLYHLVSTKTGDGIQEAIEDLVLKLMAIREERKQKRRERKAKGVDVEKDSMRISNIPSAKFKFNNDSKCC